jgi:hypothetical protein
MTVIGTGEDENAPGLIGGSTARIRAADAHVKSSGGYIDG